MVALMTVKALKMFENNDETLNLTITVAGTPYNIAASTVEMYIKPDAATADDDEAVVLLSTMDSAVTITSGVLGAATVRVPRTSVPAAGLHWYRVDIVDVLGRRTALYGPLTIVDL
jgi:hypothetical protein